MNRDKAQNWNGYQEYLVFGNILSWSSNKQDIRLYAELSKMASSYLPELPNFMQYYTWCHAHVVCARRPRTSSAHVIRAHRPHIIRSSSPRRLCVICACAYVVRTRTHHLHIIYTSSALLPTVTGGLNYLLLWQEFVIEWNLWQECWIFPFQDYVNDLWDNLCCWFSLHVTSGHCSHLICICTCHLHIIWAYAYYAHIICSGPFICSSLTDNANVIYISSLVLFIGPYMLYTHIHIICYVSFTFLI